MPLGCLETWALNNVSLGWLVSIDNKSDQTNPVFKMSISFQSFPSFPLFDTSSSSLLLHFFPSPIKACLCQCRGETAKWLIQLSCVTSGTKRYWSGPHSFPHHSILAPAAYIHTYIHKYTWASSCFTILYKLQTYAYQRGETGLRTIWSD